MPWGSLIIFRLRKMLNLSHLLQMGIQLKKETEDFRKYFSKKATNEVKEFVRASNYQKITREKNEILLYTGRIGSSPCQKRFCVPLVYTLTICLQYHQNMLGQNQYGDIYCKLLTSSLGGNWWDQTCM